MSMSDNQDDEQEVPGAGLAAWKDSAPTSGMGDDDPRAPVSKFGADGPVPAPSGLPGGGGGGGDNAGDEPQDMSPNAVRQRQRDFVPNLLGKLRDKAQSNYPQREQTEGTSGPRKAIGAALEGANENYPQNEQQGGGAQVPAMIMRYLAGGGADPNVTKQAEASATQTLSQVTDAATQSDVRLVALHEALQKGGPDAAEKVQQTYRASYAAAMGHAHVALNGTGGKPGDLAAATDAATQAETYVLNGTHTTYAPGPDGKGVIMSVQYPGNKNPATTPLTLEQFNQRTDIGDVKGGQYDAVHENPTGTGPGKPLQPIGGMTPGNAQVNRAASSAMAPQGGAPGQGAPTGHNPNAGDMAGADPNLKYRTGSGAPADPGRPFQYASDEGVDPALAKRSHALFPTVGQEQQRLQYIDKMTQQGVANEQASRKIDAPYGREQVRQEGAVAVAGIKATSNENIQGSKASSYLERANIIAASKDHDAAMKMASDIYKAGMQSSDRSMQAQGALLGKKISASALSGEPLTPQDVEAISQFSKRTVSAPQAPTPQAAAPAAPAAAAPQAPTSQNPAGGQFTPPAGQGWQFNAAKGQYRDRQGNLYDKTGKPLAQQ